MRSVVDPAGERGKVAVAQRAADHVVGEPVDLEEVDAGNVEVHAVRLAPGRSLQHVAVVEVVVVDCQERGGERVHDGDADRDRDPGGQVANVHRGLELRDQEDHRSVQDQDAEAQGQNGERQRDADEERPDQRVDEADQRRRQDRRPVPVDLEAGKDRVHEMKRGCRHEQDHDDPGHRAHAAGAPLPSSLPVRHRVILGSSRPSRAVIP